MRLRAAIALGAVAVSVLALGSVNAGSRASATTTSAVTATTSSTTPAVSAAPAQFGDVRAGQPLRLFVTVNDTTGDGIAAGTATVTVDRAPLTTRAALEDWFDGTSKASLASASVAHTETPVIDPGGTHSEMVPVSTSSLHFRTSGVYAVAVSVTSGGETVGSSRTAVTWKVSDTTAVPLAIAAPLTVPATNGGFLSATALATYTAQDGILTRELDDLEGTQVAIGIDPRILASIRVLGKTAPQSARDWLQRLTNVTNQTFPLRWADSDVTAPLQAGARSVLAVKPLDYAIIANRFASQPASTATPDPTATADPDNPNLPTARELVEFNYTMPNLTWPAENTVAKSDLSKLALSNISATILTSTNVTRPTSKVPAGASARIGSLGVAVSDATISGYLRDATGAATRDEWVAAMAKLTTSVAMVGTLSGGDANTQFATLGRDWYQTDSEFGPTVTGLLTRSFVTAADLTDATTAAPQTVTLKSRPQSADRIERVAAMLKAERREVLFSVVTAPDRAQLVSARRLVLLSLLSDEWLDDPIGWQTATSSFLKTSKNIVTSVQIVHSGSVTLLGNQVSVPVTLSNQLDQQATVYVSVRPGSTRISVEKGDQLREVTINAQSQRRIEIPIQAISNGKVPVEVSLYSVTGRQIGAARTIEINVQAGWETFGTLIFGALVVGIFAFGLVRNIRKRRKQGRGNADTDGEADDTPEPAATAEPTSE